MNTVADTYEEAALTATRERLLRSENLVNDRFSTSSELRGALRLLIEDAREAVEIATLRGERLGMEESDD